MNAIPFTAICKFLSKFEVTPTNYFSQNLYPNTLLCLYVLLREDKIDLKSRDSPKISSPAKRSLGECLVPRL
jgi:hypothetical protein